MTACLYVYKDFAYVSSMDRILELVRPRRMIEIGIHDDGSTAYWLHRCDPQRRAAFDILSEAPVFARYPQ